MPWVWAELTDADIRVCQQCGEVTLEYEMHWHKEDDKVSAVAPDLSHYYGRRVVDIVKGSGAEGDPVWSLVLEGEVVIHNYDNKLPIPGAHIKGQSFTNTTLHPKVTSMFFGGLGGNTVSLNPMKYAIATDKTDKPYYPQVSEAQETWQPPPEVAERSAEGPDEDWLREQEQGEEGS